MVKHIFAFPGQGAQTPGMMKEACEKYPVASAFLDKYSQIHGSDVKKLLWESSAEDLQRSDNSQVAITAASMAVVEILKEKGINPSAVAGFSLGEWSALYVSGILSLEDAIFAVKKRGEIMQKCCEEIAAESAGKAPGMAAVLGLDPEVILDAVKGRTDVYAANMNSDKQTVLSGTADGLAWAEAKFKELGARRVVILKVAGPFHSPLMQKAGDEFAKVLEGITFNDPKADVAIYSNVTGNRMTTGEEAKKNAILHLTQSLLWTSEEKGFDELCKAEGGDWDFIEAGPGSVLTGLWSKTPYGETVKASTWEDYLANC